MAVIKSKLMAYIHVFHFGDELLFSYDYLP